MDDHDGEADALLPTPTLAAQGTQRKRFKRPASPPLTAQNETRGQVPCSKFLPVVKYFAVFIAGFLLGVGVITSSDPDPLGAFGKGIKATGKASSGGYYHPQHRPHLPIVPPKVAGHPDKPDSSKLGQTDESEDIFPTRIGYQGPISTGTEPFVIATAPASVSYPTFDLPASLPLPIHNSSSQVYTKWGNLSPWRTVDSTSLGLDDVSRGIPEGCTLEGVHVLHRHGARYPTNSSTFGGPASFARKWERNGLRAKKDSKLSWLNDWRFTLGEEVLTPLGRQQMCKCSPIMTFYPTQIFSVDLGVHLRVRYGGLLDRNTFGDFSETTPARNHKHVPVWRTESQCVRFVITTIRG
jgi:hypothetical protein